MQAKKCDRCGSFYESCNGANNHIKRNKFMLVRVEGDKRFKYNEWQVLDLCSECMEGLMRWLYAVKNRKEG